MSILYDEVRKEGVSKIMKSLVDYAESLDFVVKAMASQRRVLSRHGQPGLVDRLGMVSEEREESRITLNYLSYWVNDGATNIEEQIQGRK